MADFLVFSRKAQVMGKRTAGLPDRVFEAIEGQSHIAEQLRAAIDKPGCVRPLAGCYWWLRAGKLRTRRIKRGPPPSPLMA
jgi:hypothetical protein